MGMNVNLTPQLEEPIRSKVALGLYTSASEAVHEARHLIDEQERLRAAKLERRASTSARASPGGRVIFHTPMADGGDVLRVLHNAGDGDPAFEDER